MNFKLKNIEDLKGETDIYIFQTSVLIDLNSDNRNERNFDSKKDEKSSCAYCDYSRHLVNNY